MGWMNAFENLHAQITACRRCQRLTEWRERVACEKRRAFRDQIYWGKGVPGFGDVQARVLVLGLAPGAHGSNRTGRMFTGDSSGDFLYIALHRAGFANQPHSTHLQDGLELTDIYISAVCRCAPPDNKPERSEIETCQPFLLEEMALLTRVQGYVALGRVAFERLLAIEGVNGRSAEFAHGAFLTLGSGRPWLLASYHPSRQNTQTGRLTAAMFDTIWVRVRSLLV